MSNVSRFWPFTRKSTQENNEQNVKIDKEKERKKKYYHTILTSINFRKTHLSSYSKVWVHNTDKLRHLSQNKENLKYLKFDIKDNIYHSWLQETGDSEGDTDRNRQQFLIEIKKEWKDINGHLDEALEFYQKYNNENIPYQLGMKSFYGLNFALTNEQKKNEIKFIFDAGIYDDYFRKLFSDDKFLYGVDGEKLYGEK